MMYSLKGTSGKDVVDLLVHCYLSEKRRDCWYQVRVNGERLIVQVCPMWARSRQTGQRAAKE